MNCPLAADEPGKFGLTLPLEFYALAGLLYYYFAAQPEMLKAQRKGSRHRRKRGVWETGKRR